MDNTLFETEWVEFWEWHHAWNKYQASRVDAEGRFVDDPVENPAPPNFGDVCEQWLQNKSFHEISHEAPNVDASEQFSPLSARNRIRETYNLEAFTQVLDLLARKTWNSDQAHTTRRKRERVASVLCDAAETISNAAIGLSLVSRLNIHLPSRTTASTITPGSAAVGPEGTKNAEASSCASPHSPLAVDSENADASKGAAGSFLKYVHYLSRFAPPKEAYMALMSVLTVCDGSMRSTRAIFHVCEPLGYCLAAIRIKRAAFLASSLSALINKIFELQTGRETLQSCFNVLSNANATLTDVAGKSQTSLKTGAKFHGDESSFKTLYGAAQWSLLVSSAVSGVLNTVSEASREAQQEDDIHGVGTNSCLCFAELSLLRFMPLLELCEVAVPADKDAVPNVGGDIFWNFSQESHSSENLQLSRLTAFSTGRWRSMWESINDDSTAADRYNSELAAAFSPPAAPEELSFAFWSNLRATAHVYYDLLAYEALPHLELRNNVQEALSESDGQLEAPPLASALTTYLLFLYTAHYQHIWTHRAVDSASAPPSTPPFIPMVASPLRLGTLFIKASLIIIKNALHSPAALQTHTAERYLFFGQHMLLGGVRYLCVCHRHSPARTSTLHSLSGVDPADVVLETITSAARTESKLMRSALMDATKRFCAIFNWESECEVWLRAMKSAQFTGTAAAIAGIVKDRWWHFATRAANHDEMRLEGTRLYRIMDAMLPTDVQVAEQADLLVAGLNLIILILRSDKDFYKALLGCNGAGVTKVGSVYPLRAALDKLAQRVDIEKQLEASRQLHPTATQELEQHITSSVCPVEVRLNLLQFVLCDARALL